MKKWEMISLKQRRNNLKNFILFKVVLSFNKKNVCFGQKNCDYSSL